MDIFDREFEQFSPQQSRFASSSCLHRLSMMIALSFLLHLFAAGVLLTPQPASISAHPVSFVDLKELDIPAPAAAEPAEHVPPSKTVETTPVPPLAPPEQQSEMDKLQSEVHQSLANAKADPEMLQERSFGLGLTNGYFTSIGQGESLRGDIREYYFAMLRQINEKWWLAREAQQEELREVIVNIVVARDGTVLEKMVMIGSGNRSLDKTMLAAIEAASPLPPLPGSYGMEKFSAPLKFMKPLNMFKTFAR